jgi:hypothetical protein
MNTVINEVCKVSGNVFGKCLFSKLECTFPPLFTQGLNENLKNLKLLLAASIEQYYWPLGD